MKSKIFKIYSICTEKKKNRPQHPQKEQSFIKLEVPAK